MVWKMIFLFQDGILRFHVNLQGCNRSYFTPVTTGRGLPCRLGVIVSWATMENRPLGQLPSRITCDLGRESDEPKNDLNIRTGKLFSRYLDTPTSISSTNSGLTSLYKNTFLQRVFILHCFLKLMLQSRFH